MSPNTNFSLIRIVKPQAAVLFLLILGAILSSPCRADYTYGGTELSWEWLPDASRAIVIGPVTSLVDDGFMLKVEHVLKRRGLAVDEGQLVGGPTLGRTQLYDWRTVSGLTTVLQRQIGWPELSDAASYPDEGVIRDTRWQPRFLRQETWMEGDRCLVFYGRDMQSPLQVINLEKPVTITVDFLAVDLAGQPVTRPERLIELIKERVEATRDNRGRPRVRSEGVAYAVWNSPLDGAHYYHVLAPPEKILASLWKPEILNRPAELNTTSSIPSLSYELPGEPSMAPQAVWYWFYSGKAEKDFAADAQQERNAAVRAGFLSERAEQDIRRRIQHHGRLDYVRGHFRQHRTNYRTYPLGWLCVRSYDQQYIAFVDGGSLHVYSVDAKSRTVDRLVVTRRDAHRARTYVEFSRDSRLVAYTTVENAVSLIDLDEGKLLWTTQAETQTVGPASENAPLAAGLECRATACLEFSGDQRYLAQQSQLPTGGAVEFPMGRYKGTQAVHVWDVKTGELVFSPYSSWQRLQFVAFHPDNSSLIRLTRRGISGEPDEIWNVRTGQLVRTLALDAVWNDE